MHAYPTPAGERRTFRIEVGVADDGGRRRDGDQNSCAADALKRNETNYATASETSVHLGDAVVEFNACCLSKPGGHAVTDLGHVVRADGAATQEGRAPVKQGSACAHFTPSALSADSLRSIRLVTAKVCGVASVGLGLVRPAANS